MFRYILSNQTVDVEKNVERSFSTVLKSQHLSACALMQLVVNENQNTEKQNCHCCFFFKHMECDISGWQRWQKWINRLNNLVPTWKITEGGGGGNKIVDKDAYSLFRFVRAVIHGISGLTSQQRNKLPSRFSLFRLNLKNQCDLAQESATCEPQFKYLFFLMNK